MGNEPAQHALIDCEGRMPHSMPPPDLLEQQKDTVQHQTGQLKHFSMCRWMLGEAQCLIRCHNIQKLECVQIQDTSSCQPWQKRTSLDASNPGCVQQEQGWPTISHRTIPRYGIPFNVSCCSLKASLKHRVSSKAQGHCL